MDRIVQLDQGVAMAISDIQGNRKDFERAYLLYSLLKKAGGCKYFLICGDLIHGYPGYPDDSFSLLKEVMSLKQEDEDIIHILGNHELAHIMHWSLQKGFINFTEGFEKEIEEERSKYWEYLSTLPFAVFSKGGVLVNHSGVSAAMAGEKSEDWDLYLSINPPHIWYQRLDFSKEFNMKGAQKEKYDPEFGQKSMDKPQGKLLWEVFMNKNEHSYRKKYDRVVDGFFETMNKIAPANVLVSSHIEESDGYKIVHEKQMRICSSYGAREDEEKKFLLFPMEQEFHTAQDLKPYLRDLWHKT